MMFLLFCACSKNSTNSDANFNLQPEATFEIVSVYPAAGSETSVTDSVVILFSGDLDCSTINTSNVRVAMGKSGTLSCNSNRVVFTPDLSFNFAIAVEVFVSKDVTDANDISLGSDYSYIFYTQVEPGK
ncbi:MAG: Ig-like domain-containing protein [candidate division Zixibacteria bacterium]|nr:Ig-like domain-containing protein [candidate division Zixibacteria bacterium]